ncbi:hypothetical protein KKF84_19100, partial [Myxococcota bacterium]|nr:hypothetical protein [Myxococcota bacterium]
MNRFTSILTNVALFALITLAIPQMGWSAPKTVNHIAKVTIRNSGATTDILLVGSRPATFSAYRHDSPPRVVLELSRTKISNFPRPIAVDSWSVSQVSQEAIDQGRGVRITVSLAKRGSYQVVSLGKTVKISITAFQPFPEASRKASARLVELKKEAALTEQRLKSARETAKKLEAQNRNRARALKSTRSERESLTETLKQSRKEIRDLLSQKKAMAKAVLEAKEKVTRFKSEERKAQKRYEAIVKHTEELNRERKAKLVQLKTITRELKKERDHHVALKASVSQYENQVTSLRKAISWKKRTGRDVGQVLTKKMATLKRTLARQRANLARAEKSISTYERRQKKVLARKASQEAKLAALKKAIATERNRLESQISKLRTSTVTLSRKKAGLVRELSALNNKKARVNALLKKEERLSRQVLRERKNAERVRREISRLARAEGEKAQMASRKAKDLKILVAKRRGDLVSLKQAKSMEQKELARLKSLRVEHQRLLKKEERRLAQLKKLGKNQEAQALRRKQALRMAGIKTSVLSAKKWELRASKSK